VGNPWSRQGCAGVTAPGAADRENTRASCFPNLTGVRLVVLVFASANSSSTEPAEEQDR
jgi:hypothetical protein